MSDEIMPESGVQADLRDLLDLSRQRVRQVWREEDDAFAGLVIPAAWKGELAADLRRQLREMADLWLRHDEHQCSEGYFETRCPKYAVAIVGHDCNDSGCEEDREWLCEDHAEEHIGRHPAEKLLRRDPLPEVPMIVKRWRTKK